LSFLPISLRGWGKREGPVSAMPHSIRDEIGALARDPHTVFLHWRVAADAPDRMDVRWLLRARDVGDGTVREVDVDPRAGNYYMSVEPGRTYEFELAVQGREGVRVICRTGRVQIPPDRPTLARGVGAFAPRFGDALRPAPDRQVPGLDYESTPLFLGSSGPKPPEEPRTHQPPGRRNA